jgi:hypothetical protein
MLSYSLIPVTYLYLIPLNLIAIIILGVQNVELNIILKFSYFCRSVCPGCKHMNISRKKKVSDGYKNNNFTIFKNENLV